MIPATLLALATGAQAQSGELLVSTTTYVNAYTNYDNINAIGRQTLISVGNANGGGNYYSSIASLGYLATDPFTGVIYATGLDTAGNGAIYRFNADGSGGTALALGGLLGTTASTQSTPRYLALHGGNLYTSVTPAGGGAVAQVPVAGGPATTYGQTFAATLTSPEALTFDTAGDLFVVNGSPSSSTSSSFTVQKFGPTGTLLTGNYTGTISAANLPGLTVGPDGELYVSAVNLGARNQVYRYSAGATAGTPDPGRTNGVQQSGAVFTGNGILSNPQGMRFSPADGNLFIAFGPNGANGSVYSYTGTQDVNNTGQGTAFSIGILGRPFDVAFSPAPEPSQTAALGIGLVGLVALALKARWRKAGIV